MSLHNKILQLNCDDHPDKKFKEGYREARREACELATEGDEKIILLLAELNNSLDNKDAMIRFISDYQASKIT